MPRPPQDASQQATPDRADTLEESLHALPGWFAWFQRTFGLSFLVIASAYLLGKLATLGWVPDLNTPAGWGIFDGAGVVIFFLAGVAVAGIGLTCSVVFVASIKRRSWFLACITGIGMLLFFSVEVWASLSERSNNLHSTPADLAVLSALGFQGSPPIGPTVIVVSVLFPLGSLYFGFVQQRRASVTQTDLDDDAMEMERRIRRTAYQARLAEALAAKRAAQARGAVEVVRAGVHAARAPRPADQTTDTHAVRHIATDDAALDDDALDELLAFDERERRNGRADHVERGVATGPFR